MKKHLPLDDFEREVQRLADGFEIQPRAMVFEQIRSELAAEPPVSGKGKVLKGIFSKSLNFISYAAAASVATVASVLVYQQQESVQQQERVLSSFQQVQSIQSQTLTQLLSDTTSTLTYESAVNDMATAQLSENTESSDQPVASDVQLATAPAKEEENAVKQDNHVTRTPVTPNTSKQVKRTENLLANTTPETKQQKQQKSNTPVVNETTTSTTSISQHSPTSVSGGSTTSIPQSATAFDQQQQSNTTETTRVHTTSGSSIPVKENSVAEVVQDSVMTGMLADSAITVASAADTTALDTTGIKRTLAARNWIKKGVWSVAAFYTLEANRTELDVPVSSDPGYYYESYNSFMSKTNQQTTSYATGVKVEYNFLNHWGISSGFTYAERKEYLSVDKHHELQYNLVSANWEINTVTTAGYSEQIRNTFTYLEVPAMVNYTNTIAGRFAFRLSAGVSYSYLMKQSASYIDMTDRSAMMGPAPVYHQSSRISETPFRQHNINLQLGANVSYLVAPRMEIFAGPHFKRSLLSTYASGYPFRQRYSATGGETGVRFYF